MKRLYLRVVMQSAELVLALLDAGLWPPRWVVWRVEGVRDWAWMKLQNMEDNPNGP